MMTIRTTLPPRGRDYGLDPFRGFANWAIYLDHIPNNVVNWVTQRNYGVSDAPDLFGFISGEHGCRQPVSSYDDRSRTAFVFAGGGSFGAIHVG